MAKRSKRYLITKKKVFENKEYSLPEAIKLIKDTSNCHFEESVEISVSLNIKPKERGERVRGTVVLPQGLGKEVKVLVFAEGEKAEKAKQKGANYVGGEELIKKIENGWMDFDATVATPEIMRKVARLGRILGPRGLMPSPKVGTVSQDPSKVVEDLKKGKIEYRNDATGGIHALIGKVSFTKEALLENIKALLSSLIKDKPPTVKGGYIRGISLCSTMGPGVRINLQQAVEIL
ncbi:MAG: 50S ribosomal protein L1 [Candidatus Aerophobetes bacterium]|nr:50S ribosomal protein L1 [Candidatus Aerophobetes bacterium]